MIQHLSLQKCILLLIEGKKHLKRGFTTSTQIGHFREGEKPRFTCYRGGKNRTWVFKLQINSCVEGGDKNFRFFI